MRPVRAMSVTRMQRTCFLCYFLLRQKKVSIKIQKKINKKNFIIKKTAEAVNITELRFTAEKFFGNLVGNGVFAEIVNVP